MVALQLKDCQIQWHDQRKSVKEINLDSCLGVLINVEEKGYVWTSNHWYAIRKYEDVYYDFNSKLQSPVPLGTASETLDHIQSAEKVGAVQIILVMHRKQIEAGESYYKNQSNEQCSDLQGSQTDEAPVHSDEAEMEELILSMSHLSPKDTKDSQFEFPFPIEKQMTGPSEAGKGVSPISSATDSSPEKGKTHKTPAPLKRLSPRFSESVPRKSPCQSACSSPRRSSSRRPSKRPSLTEIEGILSQGYNELKKPQKRASLSRDSIGYNSLIDNDDLPR